LVLVLVRARAPGALVPARAPSQAPASALAPRALVLLSQPPQPGGRWIA